MKRGTGGREARRRRDWIGYRRLATMQIGRGRFEGQTGNRRIGTVEFQTRDVDTGSVEELGGRTRDGLDAFYLVQPPFEECRQVEAHRVIGQFRLHSELEGVDGAGLGVLESLRT